LSWRAELAAGELVEMLVGAGRRQVGEGLELAMKALETRTGQGRAGALQRVLASRLPMAG
jgi:hypothetical protein